MAMFRSIHTVAWPTASLVLAAAAFWAPPAAGELRPGGIAVAVVDGDTLVLDDGREVRLVGIQAPKLPLGRPDFPGLAAGRPGQGGARAADPGPGASSFSFGGRRVDRHGRMLAHLHDDAGQWIQGEMLRQGMARVYSFADNRAWVAEMLALERAARAARRGIWSHPYYRVLKASETPKFIGGFQLVEGRVLDASVIKGRVYLNFGTDWRTDFTVSMAPGPPPPVRGRGHRGARLCRPAGARARLAQVVQRSDDRGQPPGADRGARRMSVARALLALLVLAAPVSGCALNPATGERNFTAFMTLEDERRIRDQEHPKILARFGGAYDDPALTAYVAEIGQALAAKSEMPRLDFRFTILNTPVVNAFALPGGYIYLSRGLLALADSEAELAGVLAHEIGHVTARHAARRFSRHVLANFGAELLDLVTIGGMAEAARAEADAYIQGYTRDQEFEADSLGLRYLRAAGYDAGAAPRFLNKLAA